MYLRFNNYSHDVGDVTLNVSKRPLKGPRGFRLGIVETWELRGVLHGDNVAGVTTAIQALEAAYLGSSTINSDVALLVDASTPTAHVIYAADTISGVFVDEIRWPADFGSEYSTFRSYSIRLSAEYANFEQDLIVWRESVSYRGTGGPRTVHLPTAVGKWQKQQVSDSSLCYCTQKGTATGYSDYPSFPFPLFPADENQDLRVNDYGSGQQRGRGIVGFSINWQYQFEKNEPFGGGLPTSI